MSAGKRLLTFISGTLLGAAIGTASAVLFAPRSGEELKGRILDRVREAKLAGVEAQAAKQDELIQKYRQDVDDPTALREEEARLRVEAAQAVTAIGLGLNAPGAIAAQEAALRATAEPAVAAAPGAAPAPRVANTPGVFGTAPGVGTPPGVGTRPGVAPAPGVVGPTSNVPGSGPPDA